MIRSYSSGKTHILKGKVREHRLAKKQEAKIDKLAEKYYNVPRDDIEGWVNDDFDDMAVRLDESRTFFERLEEHGNIPIKSTGKTWYHSERRIGRIFKSIHESNIQGGNATMLIFRDGDTTIYRLTVKSGQEYDVLSKALSKGYILSEIIVNYGDI